MGFKGEFGWYNSLQKGGRKAIFFTLTNNSWIGSETFDAALLDGSGQGQPMIYRQLTLQHGESYRFDLDTVGWEWCQGDKFAILDSKGEINKHWDLNITMYAPGECPECHGTHKCKYCNGNGHVTDRRSHTLSLCTACGGTGMCQTCYIPTRSGMLSGYMSPSYTPYGGYTSQQPDANAAREKKIAALRQRIYELQSKVERVDWDLRIMDRRGTSSSSYMVYSSRLNERLRYEQEIIKLQSQIDELERMR